MTNIVPFDDELVPLVYQDLHQRARNYLRTERPHHTLQPTALIHEEYPRLISDCPAAWNGRAHFFAVAACVMRQILVDRTRRRQAGKRGSRVVNMSQDDPLVPARSESSDLMALDAALQKFAAFGERKCRILEMRYFGGCTVDETAEAFGIAGINVMREMLLEQASLRRSVRGEAAGA